MDQFTFIQGSALFLYSSLQVIYQLFCLLLFFLRPLVRPQKKTYDEIYLAYEKIYLAKLR